MKLRCQISKINSISTVMCTRSVTVQTPRSQTNVTVGLTQSLTFKRQINREAFNLICKNTIKFNFKNVFSYCSKFLMMLSICWVAYNFLTIKCDLGEK